MNNLIKKILNWLCEFLTRCVNNGQHIMCRKESFSMWKLPQEKPSKEALEDFRRYKANLKKYGFSAKRRDFFVFCNYLMDKGNDPALIVPSYIVHCYLTAVFNPIPFNAYFEDKNNFDRILPKDWLPRTLLRRRDGFWYDRDYRKVTEPINILNSVDSQYGIIVKPARNSSSGRGIELFRKEKGKWLNLKDDKTLTHDLIQNCWGSSDLIIQSVIRQNEFFRKFCDTSVNTLRIVVYNSPLNDEKSLIWAGLRIGKSGSLVDNTHAGGLMFGVSREGRIAKYGADQFGNKFREFNGLNFAKEDFLIPDFEKIVDLCLQMSDHLLPHRFIAFDVAVNEDGVPMIIEYNLRAYGGWACQFAGDPMFGDKTEEILKYLSENKTKGIKFFYSIN